MSHTVPSSPYENFFSKISEPLLQTYNDFNQHGQHVLSAGVGAGLRVCMRYSAKHNSWVPRQSGRYSFEDVQDLCDSLIQVTPQVPMTHFRSLHILFWILAEADRNFHNISKTITIRTVYSTRTGVRTTIKERTYTIDAQHTLQQAVRREYPLPGVCMTVERVRDRVRLWDRSDRTMMFFNTNQYFNVTNGDIVEIVLPLPKDELPPSGPATHTQLSDLLTRLQVRLGA